MGKLTHTGSNSDVQDEKFMCRMCSEGCSRGGSSRSWTFHRSYTRHIIVCAVILLTILHTACGQNMKVDIGDIVNSLDVGTKGGKSQKGSPVMLMWGIADTSATVGKMFNYAIPDDAFKGTVLKYKVII